MSKHAHRRIPSRIRTVGRLARSLRRMKLQKFPSLHLITTLIGNPIPGGRVHRNWIKHKDRLFDAAEAHNEKVHGFISGGYAVRP